MQNFNEKALAVTAEVSKAVLGKPEVVLKIMMAMLARGHVLIEDIPGVGKTTLAQAFARAMDLTQNRVQFTPDVLPSDIVGFSLYQKETGKFVYHPGAIACNLFLADEINRTSARTQSALLEVMEESAVTVDGVTRPLPQPFTVMATENPVGSVGTQMLPESQLDRFMVCVVMGYPDAEAEMEILARQPRHALLDRVQPGPAGCDRDFCQCDPPPTAPDRAGAHRRRDGGEHYCGCSAHHTAPPPGEAVPWQVRSAAGCCWPCCLPWPLSAVRRLRCFCWHGRCWWWCFWRGMPAHCAGM